MSLFARLKYYLQQPIPAGTGVFFLLCSIGAISLVYLNTDTRKEIDLLATASSDNTPWNLSQGEIELHQFEKALLRTDPLKPESIRDAKKKFDIFYSRIRQFETASSSAHVMSVAANELAHASAFIDETVSYIDGPEREFIEAIPEILERVEQLLPDLRTISRTGSYEAAKHATMQRQSVFKALDELSLSVFLLFALLLGSLIALLYMVIASRRQAHEIGLGEQRLKSIIATSLDAIIVTDAEGRVLECNKSAETLFKSTHGEAQGQRIDGRFHEQTDSPIPAGTAHLPARAAGLGPVTLRAEDSEGHIFPIELTCDTTANGSMYVMFVRDISQRLAAQQELVHARDRAVAGEQAKANLLAVMSHEIRTPLNGVLGAVELLADSKLSNKQRNLIDIMQTSGRALMKHVNDVLVISRADSGKMQTQAEPFELDTTCRQVVESLCAQAVERGNALDIEFPDGELGPVVGDKWRLNQVLFNLIGNAIKFTKNGKISLEIERHPGTDLVEFRVIDTGVGINAEDSKRVFDDFVTLDSSYNRAAEGTGLGLGIVKRLVALLGGHIGVESQLGEGSAFWFTLPLPPASESRELQAHPEQPHFEDASDASSNKPLANVLIVEDNEINRLVVMEMLSRINVSAQQAIDGLDGVMSAKAKKFDAIFMDVSMPGMDGLTATQKIREGSGPNVDTPIIALTAHSLEDDKEKCLNAGMNMVLTKPVSISQLKRAIEGLMGVDKPANGTRSDDLVSVIGKDRAEQIRTAAVSELNQGFDQLDQMIANSATRDDIAALAHKLVGTATLLTDLSVHSLLSQLETQLKEDTGEDQLSGAALQISQARKSLAEISA